MEKEKDFSKINISLIKAAVQEKKEALDYAVSMMQNVIDRPNDYTPVIKDSVYVNLVAELSCSIIAGDLNDLEEKPRYMHSIDGGCYFIFDDIAFEVLQLVNICPPFRTSDIAVPLIYYRDESDDAVTTMHILDRDCWLYGATSSDFDEYKPVHTEFVQAAKAYIKEKGKEFLLKAQEGKDDE